MSTNENESYDYDEIENVDESETTIEDESENDVEEIENIKGESDFKIYVCNR